MKRVDIGRKSLFSDRKRALLGIAGVAAALLLALALDGIFAGVTRQLTRYIDSSPAEVFVSQRGVRTMHMSSSAMPLSVAKQLRQVAGVEWAEPILYLSSSIAGSGTRQLSYVVGYDPAGRAKPELTEGRAPARGQIVVDDQAARAMNLRLGNEVSSLGRTWRVSGFTSGLTNITNTLSFVPFDDFAEALNLGGTASYVLVGTESDPAVVARRIERATGVTAQTRAQFSSEERGLVRDMSADLLKIMTAAAFLIALTVIGLTLYAGTLARIREIGVIKALGGNTRRLVGIVLSQALWTVGPAVVLALVILLLLSVAVAAFSENVSIAIEAGSVFRTAAGAVALAILGAAAPLLRISKVDPATVFRR